LEKTMNNTYELFVSARDAEALAAMLGEYRRAHPFEPHPADELADLVMQARLVPIEELPADRVALSSRVTYVEEPSGLRRTVTLVLPADANPAAGTISVLSPIGRALIGRKRGETVDAELPGRRLLEIRILATERRREPLRQAA
jgi:regulator of nucleoside diphosphate kinase